MGDLFYKRNKKPRSKCKHIWEFKEEKKKRGKIWVVFKCTKCTGTRGEWKK